MRRRRAAAKLDPALMAGAERPIAPLVMTSIDRPLRPLPCPATSNRATPGSARSSPPPSGSAKLPPRTIPSRIDSSCWDPHWAKNYGGNDTPDTAQRTAEYIPRQLHPRPEPILRRPALQRYGARRPQGRGAPGHPLVPEGIQGPDPIRLQGPLDRHPLWLKVCYAQWEDAGPFRTDHWQYVFGNERPRPNLNGGAGLDVSPAVRDYLGMNSTDVTDWKFVDFEEVPTGPWARYGENNTFVQNARKPASQVAESDHQPGACQAIREHLCRGMAFANGWRSARRCGKIRIRNSNLSAPLHCATCRGNRHAAQSLSSCMQKSS